MKERICPECGTELMTLGDSDYGLCDDCLEEFEDRRDRIDPNFCIHGNLKEHCETCLTDWED